MRELNTIHITEYTPRFRRTNSLGRRQLLTPDEVLRMPTDQELIFIRGQKVMRAKRYDYSLHPEYKRLTSEKAITYEPDWESRRAFALAAQSPSEQSSPQPPEPEPGQTKPPAPARKDNRLSCVNESDIF